MAADETETLSTPPSPHRFNWKRFGMILGASLGLWVFLFLILLIQTRADFAIKQIVLPTLMVSLVICVALRQDRRWNEPARRFKQIFDEIRTGQAAIDALDEVEGALGEIRSDVQALLRELRLKQQSIAEMNAEMQARIANRTDALERAMGSLRAQATRDALTGLYNRRMLDEFLPRLIEQCRTDGEQLTVLMVDVDNFKPINDTLGHAAGDKLLKDISQLIRSTIRDHDAAFRCGGDEFVIVLPRCSESGARKLLERLVSLVDALARTIKSPLPPRLSIGMAIMKDAASTPESLLKQADEQLYEIKRGNKSKQIARYAKAG